MVHFNSKSISHCMYSIINFRSIRNGQHERIWILSKSMRIRCPNIFSIQKWILPNHYALKFHFGSVSVSVLCKVRFNTAFRKRKNSTPLEKWQIFFNIMEVSEQSPNNNSNTTLLERHKIWTRCSGIKRGYHHIKTLINLSFQAVMPIMETTS